MKTWHINLVQITWTVKKVPETPAYTCNLYELFCARDTKSVWDSLCSFPHRRVRILGYAQGQSLTFHLGAAGDGVVLAPGIDARPEQRLLQLPNDLAGQNAHGQFQH